MSEFFVHINPADASKAKKIVSDLQNKGLIPDDANVYVGADSNIQVTRPPTARVERIFSDDSGAVDTARITS